MRISLSRESLKQALELCSKVVNGKSPREELRCVRIEAKAEKAFIQATNLEEWLTLVSSEAKVVAEGTCVVDLAELKAFVKDAQPKRFIEIESDGGAVKAATEINGVSIARGIKAQKLEDWPVFHQRPEKMFKASSSFLEAIRQAAPSTSSKDFRRALACVYVSEGLAVATDGHHLTALPCPTPFKESVLVKPSKLIESGLVKGVCQVGLELPEKGKGAGKLTIETDSLTWTTALSDAEYPNFRQVVPNERTMPISVLFGENGAAMFLKAIPALKSSEGSIAISCRHEGVFAGNGKDNAKFNTGAGSNAAKEFNIELLAANLERALELGMRELKMTDSFSPVLFKGEHGAFMASMPVRAKNSVNPIPKKEESPMSKQNVQPQTTPQTQAPAINAGSNGFMVNRTQPQNTQAVDPFDELMRSAEEAKASARTNYENASQFVRKLRDVQSFIKRRDKEAKATREIIEKLKTASGF